MASKEFTDDKEYQKNIKEAMDVFLHSEAYGLLKRLGISEKLDGWEKLLHLLCIKNELFDVKTINMPDFTKDLHNQDYYVFAGYLKPGYHQLLIYDPLLERAYCKDFVVNLNLAESIFPEYPNQDQEPNEKRVANVWRYWLEDSQEDKFKSFQEDSAGQDNFMISKYIRCEVD